jgi:glycosyltransferase involved in cell wall biosynthesis
VGGIPEVVTDDVDGVLVPAGDPAALATALVRLLGDPAHAGELGRRAAVRATEFDLPAAVRHIERVYDEALGRC